MLFADAVSLQGYRSAVSLFCCNLKISKCYTVLLLSPHQLHTKSWGMRLVRSHCHIYSVINQACT